MRVLIVDDSKNMRHILRNILETTSGIEIIEAGNGADAENILQENNALQTPIDLIFLDWMMPIVSGYEFLKKIRTTSLFFEYPKIVMLTAETYPEQMNACVKYGVSLYITKPFSKHEILSALSKIEDEMRGYKNAI